MFRVSLFVSGKNHHEKPWTGPKFPGPLPSAVEATTRPTINPYKPRAFQTGSDSGWKCKNKLSWFLVDNLFCWIFLLHFLLLGLDWQLVSCFLVYSVFCLEYVQLVVGCFSLVGYSWWMVGFFLPYLEFSTSSYLYLVQLIVNIQLVIAQVHPSVAEEQVIEVTTNRCTRSTTRLVK